MSVPRGIEPFRDTLDVRLDSRQVFLLFFGGAISACLVFALGVMVGRRLEAKTARSDARVVAPNQVPLAQLDQIADEEDELSFHQQLSSGKGGGAGDALANGPKLAPKPAAPAPAASPVAKADKKKSEKQGTGDGEPGTGNVLKKSDAPVKKPDVVADKPVKKPDVAKPEVAKADAAAVKVAKVDAAAVKAAKAEEAAAAKAAKVDAKAAKVDAKAAKADAAEGKKFALTLPTFTDKAEADALCAKLSSNGYSYHVASVTTPDASVVYRVRVGEFATRADALTAKTEFEKKQHVIAYVTKLP